MYDEMHTSLLMRLRERKDKQFEWLTEEMYEQCCDIFQYSTGKRARYRPNKLRYYIVCVKGILILQTSVRDVVDQLIIEGITNAEHLVIENNLPIDKLWAFYNH